MLYIHPDECVDCGACEPVCPVEAIYYEDDLPEEWSDYYKANVEFFSETASARRAAPPRSASSPATTRSSPRSPRRRTDAAAPRSWPSSSPTSPGTPSPRTASGLAPIPAASSTSRSGRRSTRPRMWCAPPCAPPTMRTGTRRPPASPALREAIVDWYARRHGVALEVANVLPTIGSKELVALMPTLLGLRPGDVVVRAGARLPELRGRRRGGRRHRARLRRPGRLAGRDAAGLAEQPGQPRRPGARGRVPAPAPSRRARELGAVIANDECYAELNWAGSLSRPPASWTAASSATAARLTLSVSSLSKQSNLAGYRAGFVAGCSRRRRRAARGAQAPRTDPARPGAGRDDRGPRRRRARRGAARAVPRTPRRRMRRALEGAGFRIDESAAGLYLWATRGRGRLGDGRRARRPRHPGHARLVLRRARAREHVRVALTATDADVAEAARRLVQVSNR